MTRTFYVDSRTGSDSSAGTAAAPWASVDRVNAAGLQPGDTVLFARGATFTGTVDLQESGAAGAPITFGAYGTGAAPVIAGGANGVSGNGHDHIVVRDLHITDKSGAGVISFGSSDWIVDNVDVDNVGQGYVPGNNEFSAFQFRDVEQLVIQNSSYEDVAGDGVFLWNASEVKILHNDFGTPTGPSSDNIHSYRMSDYEIRGNVMSFAEETDSGKGNMVVQESRDGIIAENTFIMTNAHYAIGGTIQDGVVEKNHFIDRAEGTWSTGLNITETLGSPSTVANMTIRDNFFDGVGTGIYTWDGNGAGTAYRSNFNVTGNIFKDLRDPAVVSEGPVALSGAYADNMLVNSAGPSLGGTASAWALKNNISVADADAALTARPQMVAGAPWEMVHANEVFASVVPAPASAASVPQGMPITVSMPLTATLLSEIDRSMASASLT